MTKVAIVGTGYIASYHMAALALIRDVEVTCVCDAHLASAQKFADSAGIPHVYTSLGQLLEEQQVDAVHICTPATSHSHLAQQAIAAGARVFVEKPISVELADAEALAESASKGGCVATNHNFLFARPYERLRTAVRSGQLGALTRINILWHKPFDLVRSTRPHWTLNSPTAIMKEIGPHLFSAAMDLGGELEIRHVDHADPIDLANGGTFYRQWLISCTAGSVPIQIQISFADVFVQHRLDVSGTAGSASVDFERNVFTQQRHSRAQADLDSMMITLRTSRDWLLQGVVTMVDFVRSKAGLSRAGAPFADSIYRSIDNFYQKFRDQLDSRHDTEMAVRTIQLAETAGAFCGFSDGESAATVSVDFTDSSVMKRQAHSPVRVFVTGGTGFIGRALVKKLDQLQIATRVLVRSETAIGDLAQLQHVEFVQGDVLEAASFRDQLDGIRWLVHLARGDGVTWDEFNVSDLIPTKKLAALCAEHEIQFIYASTIAVHCPDKPGEPILNSTPPSQASMDNSLYARSKGLAERHLQQSMASGGLKAVIVRPGIVIGEGCTPLHSGIASFPYGFALALLYGDGHKKLPIVLLEDCVEAIANVILLQADAAKDFSGNAFNIVGQPLLTAREYLAALSDCAQLPVAVTSQPAFSAWMGEMLKYLVTAIGGKRSSRPKLSAVRGLAFHAAYDIDQTMAELEWLPTQDLDRLIERGIRRPTREHLFLD